MVTTSALVTSLVTSLIISGLILIIFTFLHTRRGNAYIYYPSLIYQGREPPGSRKRGVFTWLTDVLRTREDDLVGIAGLDATCYIRFLFTCLAILVWAALYCLAVLLPVCATDHYYVNHNKGISDPNKQLKYTSFDKLGMGNVTPKSNRLWAAAIGAYWVSLGAIVLLYWTYRDIVSLRSRFYGIGPTRVEQLAVLVRDIPKAGAKLGLVGGKKADAAAVNDFFGLIYGPSYSYSVIIPKLKPSLKLFKKVVKAKKKLAHAEAVGYLAEAKGGPVKTPMVRPGFLGLFGKKQEAIPYWRGQVEELVPELQKEQESAMQSEGIAAVCFFKNQVTAAAASQALHADNNATWTVTQCPEPREVVVENLGIPIFERSVREVLVYTITFLMILFYMIPIAFVSGITTISNLRKLLPFLKAIVNRPVLEAVLQAYLPQIALIVFLAVLPALCKFLSKVEGIPQQSHIVRAAAGKYFYFNVFNVFLGVTLTGSLFGSLKQIIKSPTQIVNLLSSSLPQNASFFITYIALKFLVSNALELSRLVALVLFHVKKKFLCKTQFELEAAWYPGAINYVKSVPSDLLIITLALCYSVIAPMILPFAICYFATTWVVMKNQALKVYIPDFESRARMWPHMHARILAALGLSQLTMLGYFGIKKFAGTVLMIPLPILTIMYWLYSYKKYYRSFKVTALDKAAEDSIRDIAAGDSLVDSPNLVTEFAPDCLKPMDSSPIEGSAPLAPGDTGAAGGGAAGREEVMMQAGDGTGKMERSL